MAVLGCRLQPQRLLEGKPRQRCLSLLCLEPNRGVAQPGSASALGAEGRRFESFRPDQQASHNINTGNTWEPGHASDRALRMGANVQKCPRKSNVSPGRIQVWELNVCSWLPRNLVKNRHQATLRSLLLTSPEARPAALDGDRFQSLPLLGREERNFLRIFVWSPVGHNRPNSPSAASFNFRHPDVPRSAL